MASPIPSRSAVFDEVVDGFHKLDLSGGVPRDYLPTVEKTTKKATAIIINIREENRSEQQNAPQSKIKTFDKKN